MQTSDFATANDYMGRALTVLERTFHVQFSWTGTGKTTASPPSVSSSSSPFPPSCRISYNCAPNRLLFITLYLHSQLVARKGCWRTALEVSKCALRLDPIQDPLGIWLWADFLASRAQEWQWVCDVWSQLGDSASGEGRMKWYPNWAWTSALAHFRVEKDHGKESHADVLLKRTMLAFPWMIAMMASKCNLTIDSEIMAVLSSDSYFQEPSDSRYIAFFNNEASVCFFNYLIYVFYIFKNHRIVGIWFFVVSIMMLPSAFIQV
jgi:hypothetical protein